LTFSVSRSEPSDYSVYIDGVLTISFKMELLRESDGILIFSAALVGVAFHPRHGHALAQATEHGVRLLCRLRPSFIAHIFKIYFRHR